MKLQYYLIILCGLCFCACQKQAEVSVEPHGRVELVFEAEYSETLTPESFEQTVNAAIKDLAKVDKTEFTPEFNQEEKLVIKKGRYTLVIPGTSATKAAELKRRMNMAPVSMHIYM